MTAPLSGHYVSGALNNTNPPLPKRKREKLGRDPNPQRPNHLNALEFRHKHLHTHKQTHKQDTYKHREGFFSKERETMEYGGGSGFEWLTECCSCCGKVLKTSLPSFSHVVVVTFMPRCDTERRSIFSPFHCPPTAASENFPVHRTCTHCHP